MSGAPAVVLTGGAGYIGSHVALALLDRGHEVWVIDDLSGGPGAPLPSAIHFTRGDILEPGALARLVAASGARGILHFAGRIAVGESMARPELHYRINVGGMIAVAEAAAQARLPVLFSSSAAVYGAPLVCPIPVTHPCRPESPYGTSKWMSEQILADCSRAHGFPFAALRYFNAAGARPGSGLGERHTPETHLIPLAIDAARAGTPLSIFGDDWPTDDGTAVRDYVHVVDHADAHVRALHHLLGGRGDLTVNLGAGEGVSVRQVLAAVERALGRQVPHRVVPRRSGDVARLVADVRLAEQLLGWRPERSGIDRLVADAVAAR